MWFLFGLGDTTWLILFDATALYHISQRIMWYPFVLLSTILPVCYNAWKWDCILRKRYMWLEVYGMRTIFDWWKVGFGIAMGVGTVVMLFVVLSLILTAIFGAAIMGGMARDFAKPSPTTSYSQPYEQPYQQPYQQPNYQGYPDNSYPQQQQYPSP